MARTPSLSLDSKSTLESIIRAAFETGDRDLLLLRSHMLIETLLYYLLATSLDVTVEELPNCNFATLAGISLAGDRLDDMRRATLELNTLRNRVAHRLQDPGVDSLVENFIRSCRVFTGVEEQHPQGDGDFGPPLKKAVLALGRAILDEAANHAERRFLEAKAVTLKMNLDMLGFDVGVLEGDLIEIDDSGRLDVDLSRIVRTDWPLVRWTISLREDGAPHDASQSTPGEIASDSR